MIRLDSIIARTALEPRPYQRRIVQKNVDMFRGRYKGADGKKKPAARSIMIESPTGSGKTPMALMTARLLQEEIQGLHVGWIAMRRNLLAQARNENIDKRIGVQDIHFISMFDKHPDALLKAKAEGKPILLVVDEAQHDAANSCAHLHNILEPQFILGTSATPFRTDRIKLCFDAVVKDAGIHQLIKDGYLSQYDHFSIDKWTPLNVANHYCAEPERWGKSLFYFVNLNWCWELSRLFKQRGVVHDVVTGDTDVDAQIDAFRAGEMPCLINCMKLTEGFDDPSLKTAWVRPSGRGPTIQMAGRAFRKHPTISRKQVVQCKETRWPMIRTAMPEQQYLWQSESWRSLTVNPLLNQINQNTRIAIANAEVELPKYLVDRLAKKAPRLRF